jgi:DNA polymerase III alpha subunit
MLTNLTEKDILKSIQIYGTDIIENCLYQDFFEKYINIIDAEKLSYPVPKLSVDTTVWNIPTEYKNLNIEEFLINVCPKENYQRLHEELELFYKNDMIMVLKTMKYLVDTFRKNNVVWGVGRGSSVASYILYLIGVHKVDSVKYELPITEFFKGEKNG